MSDEEACGEPAGSAGEQGPEPTEPIGEREPTGATEVAASTARAGADVGAGTDSGNGGDGTFEVTHEELRTTFEYQVQRLQEIDGKAIEILKANLLLIGIVVTGGSILIQTDLDLAPFVNVFTVAGGLLLLASTGLAAVTYTASNLRGGLDVGAVEAAIAADVSTAEGDGSRPAVDFETRLLRSYARWIDYNARVTAVNDLLATVTVLLVFVAFVYVVAGVVVAGLGLSVVATGVAFLTTTAVATAFTWLASHMDHLGATDDRWRGTFDGVRLSKGTTRRDGLTALREMLGRPTTDDRDPDDAESHE